MNIKVWVPSTLRVYCNGVSDIPLSASTVQAALLRLKEEHPALYPNICDEAGAVRRHLNVFVNKTHIRDRDGLETTLSNGDVVLIVPAVSGG